MCFKVEPKPLLGKPQVRIETDPLALFTPRESQVLKALNTDYLKAMAHLPPELQSTLQPRSANVSARASHYEAEVHFANSKNLDDPFYFITERALSITGDYGPKSPKSYLLEVHNSFRSYPVITYEALAVEGELLKETVTFNEEGRDISIDCRHNVLAQAGAVIPKHYYVENLAPLCKCNKKVRLAANLKDKNALQAELQLIFERKRQFAFTGVMPAE